MQESKRYKSTYGEYLADHFANLTRLYDTYKFVASSVWNCEETGSAPERDVTGRSKNRGYLYRRSKRDMKVSEFKNAYSVTMMPAVSAAGDFGLTLFVFKGKRLPYQRVLWGGVESTENYSSYLAQTL